MYDFFPCCMGVQFVLGVYVLSMLLFFCKAKMQTRELGLVGTRDSALVPT